MIYTVKCAEHVARKIVDEVHHPEVELLGFDGCNGISYAVNMLISLIRHPNVGAVLTVGLGCEYVQPEWLEKIALQEEQTSSGSGSRMKEERFRRSASRWGLVRR